MYSCDENELSKNVVDHCITECTYLQSERVKIWDRIYPLNPLVYTYLRGLDSYFSLEKYALILFQVLKCIHSRAWSYPHSIASGLYLSYDILITDINCLVR